MKYIILITAALFFSITSANADNYVRFSTGNADASISTPLGGIDSSTSAIELTYGIEMNDSLAIEAAYIDTGTASGSIGAVDVAASVDGFAVMAALNKESGRFIYGARGGLFKWGADIATSVGSASESGFDLIYGAHAGFKFSEKFSVRGSYTVLPLDSADVTVMSVGIELGL